MASDKPLSLTVSDNPLSQRPPGRPLISGIPGGRPAKLLEERDGVNMAYSLGQNDVLSLTIDGRHDGQQVMLTSHYRIEAISPGLSVSSDDFFSAWAADLDAVGNLNDVYVACLSEDVTNLRYVMQRLAPDRQARLTFPAAQDSGDVAGVSMPPNVAHVIVVRSDDVGRKERGNKHIGGVPSSFTEGGLVTALGLTAYVGLAEVFKLDQNIVVGADTVTLQPIIFHRSTPSVGSDITTYAIGTTTRVMRRRTVGLGS